MCVCVPDISFSHVFIGFNLDGTFMLQAVYEIAIETKRRKGERDRQKTELGSKRGYTTQNLHIEASFSSVEFGRQLPIYHLNQQTQGSKN